MSIARHRAGPAGGVPGAGHALAQALGEALDLALARSCAGCGAPGTRWCAGCWPALTGPAVRRVLDIAGHCAPGPGDLAPGAAEPGAPGPGVPVPLVVWSAALYDGPVQAALVAWKDHERPDVTAVLALALRRAARSALAELTELAERPAAGPGGALLVVPAPSSAAARRARGRRPVLELARRAVGGPAATSVAGRWGSTRPAGQVLPVLEQRRGVRDQSGLGAVERAGNLAGAVRVPASWRRYVRGRPCLLVDDVVTSGATLSEAARALRAAGAGPVVAATVATTVLRSGVRAAASGG